MLSIPYWARLYRDRGEHHDGLLKHTEPIHPAEIYDPLRALRRVHEGGRAYWHAWGIALAALLLSFTGLLALGVGFLATSVWFWQVAGFSFARVFTQRHLAAADAA